MFCSNENNNEIIIPSDYEQDVKNFKALKDGRKKYFMKDNYLNITDKYDISLDEKEKEYNFNETKFVKFKDNEYYFEKECKNKLKSLFIQKKENIKIDIKISLKDKINPVQIIPILPFFILLIQIENKTHYIYYLENENSKENKLYNLNDSKFEDIQNKHDLLFDSYHENIFFQKYETFYCYIMEVENN